MGVIRQRVPGCVTWRRSRRSRTAFIALDTIPIGPPA